MSNYSPHQCYIISYHCLCLNWQILDTSHKIRLFRGFLWKCGLCFLSTQGGLASRDTDPNNSWLRILSFADSDAIWHLSVLLTRFHRYFPVTDTRCQTSKNLSFFSLFILFLSLSLIYLLSYSSPLLSSSLNTRKERSWHANWYFSQL